MRYPVYIISKGRWKNNLSLTANFLKKDNIKFLIAVEPQEYDNYCNTIGEEYVLKLPFSNLGLGSYPARNFCWEHSIKKGYERHWLFDDNIRGIRYLNKGNRIIIDTDKALCILEDFTDRYINVGISGFNYSTFTHNSKKPFYLNCHVYSGLLINNNMPYRWRLKYNEDVDLCLQVLSNNLTTILFNILSIDKTSTATKMKGGNQTELYKGNDPKLKILKAKSLEQMWKDYNYVKVIKRFNRPHHFVDWKKHFKTPLIKKVDVDLTNKYDLKLIKTKNIKSEDLKKYYNNYGQ